MGRNEGGALLSAWSASRFCNNTRRGDLKVLPPVVLDEADAGFKNSSPEGGGGANSAAELFGAFTFSLFEASSFEGGEKSFLSAFALEGRAVLSAVDEVLASDSFRRPGELAATEDTVFKDCRFLGET